LEKLYRDGRVKAIGVSNFTISHLKELLANCHILPMVNQIEFHPG
jgi:diketogulonate reductase-like aldo/keto reductase